MTLPNNPPFLHHYYLIDYLSEFYRVGWHYDCLASQVPAEGFTHQELTHVDVDSTQHIVQQINISVRIKGSSKCDSGLLASGDVDALFSNLRFDPERKNLEIIFQ